MSTHPVLDLDAELLELDITYQGVTYDLNSRAELSILQLRQLSGMLHSYDNLTSVEDGDEENAVQIGEALQKIATMLVKGDPPKDGFPEQLCAKILGFWTEQHGPPPGRPRRAPQDRLPKQKTKAKSTGAK